MAPKCVANIDNTLGVLQSDMSPAMQQSAINIMKRSVQKSRIFREIATSCKQEMDAEFGPCWQCVVGQEYGLWVSHNSGEFIFSTVKGFGILLFRVV